MKMMIVLAAILLNIWACSERSSEKDAEFEGRVEYTVRQIAKGPDSIAKSNRILYGSGMRAHLKKGKYKQIYMNAAGIDWALYDDTDNRYYFKVPEIDTLYYVDCSVEPDSYQTDTLPDTQKILNYNCKSMELRGGGNKHKIFFAPELYLNPEHLAASKYHGNNLVAQTSRSVYLKWVTEADMVTTIMEAVNVKREKVDDEIFRLPKLPQKQVN